MRPKITFETCIYAIAILLAVIALIIVAASYSHFSDTKPVYQGF